MDERRSLEPTTGRGGGELLVRTGSDGLAVELHPVREGELCRVPERLGLIAREAPLHAELPLEGARRDDDTRFDLDAGDGRIEGVDECIDVRHLVSKVGEDDGVGALIDDDVAARR